MDANKFFFLFFWYFTVSLKVGYMYHASHKDNCIIYDWFSGGGTLNFRPTFL